MYLFWKNIYMYIRWFKVIILGENGGQKHPFYAGIVSPYNQ